jgi:ABC-2 type transport system ATP-binding protein
MSVRLDTTTAIAIETTDIARFRTTVAAAARDTGARLLEVTGVDDDLESVFRYLVTPR